MRACRSELAREKLTGAAFIQEACVIVDVFREQARSYSCSVCVSGFAYSGEFRQAYLEQPRGLAAGQFFQPFMLGQPRHLKTTGAST